MSWIVTQDYIKGKLTYLVENTETGERCGEFDWQARAQEFADQLNSGDIRVAHSDKGHFGRSESLKCAELGKKVSEGLVEGLKTEDALKLIDSLMVTNGTFRRDYVHQKGGVMARDCIFYSEDNDMGATIPFCNFENSSDWNCCKYYGHKDSTQESCPHYISGKDGLELLRRTKSKMTRREKIKQEMTDPYLWHYICCEGKADANDCICPVKKICENEDIAAAEEEFKAWLDEEVEEG